VDQREVEVEELLTVTKDSPPIEKYSVVIVGGGPAGIATALTLNALRISNCVVDAQVSPNRKYGEALPPNAKPVLKQLGIQSLVEYKNHLSYYGNQTSWGSKQMNTKEFISELHGSGYLLDRLFFEDQLWEYYRIQNGKIYNGFKVKEIKKKAQGHGVVLNSHSCDTHLNCDFIVDATGRKATISQRLGAIKKELDTQFALTFTLDLSKPIERNIFIESVPNGWWYASPNSNQTMTLMFFTLKKMIPKKGEINNYLEKEMKSSKYISNFLNASKLKETTVKIIPAGTSRLDQPYGTNWLAVGDAACAYDPISSYGITSALASGYYAGQAIASHLSGKIEAMISYRYIIENAFHAYCEKLINHYREENQWPESYYWKNRFADKN
jgi:flavin-dependent dehydrogenase